MKYMLKKVAKLYFGDTISSDEVVEDVSSSIDLHLLYITLQNIPLALINETLTADRRSRIAVGISSIPRPKVLAGLTDFGSLVRPLNSPDSWGLRAVSSAIRLKV